MSNFLFELYSENSPTKPMQTPNTNEYEHGRQTAGANVRSREGNNPDRQLRSQIMIKWETMWEGTNS